MLERPGKTVFADGCSLSPSLKATCVFPAISKTPPMETETAFIPQRWDISGGTGEGGSIPSDYSRKLHTRGLHQPFARDLQLDIHLRHSGRLKIAVGSLVALLDSEVGASVVLTSSSADKRKMSRRASTKRQHWICRFADGQILLEYDGHVLFAGHQEMPGPLKISTWAGDTLDFNLVKLAGNPTPFHMSARRHPVP